MAKRVRTLDNGTNVEEFHPDYGQEGYQESSMMADQQQAELSTDMQTSQLDTKKDVAARQRRKAPSVEEMLQLFKLMPFEERRDVIKAAQIDLQLDISDQIEAEEKILKAQHEKASKLRALMGGTE